MRSKNFERFLEEFRLRDFFNLFQLHINKATNSSDSHAHCTLEKSLHFGQSHFDYVYFDRLFGNETFVNKPY